MKYLPSDSVMLVVIISVSLKKKSNITFLLKWKKPDGNAFKCHERCEFMALFHNLSSECVVSLSKHMYPNKSIKTIILEVL